MSLARRDASQKELRSMKRTVYRIVRDAPHITERELISEAKAWKRTVRPDLPPSVTPKRAIAWMVRRGELEYSERHMHDPVRRRLVVSASSEADHYFTGSAA